PDGKRIAFHGGTDVWIIGADGTGESRVIAGINQFNMYSHPTFTTAGMSLLVDRGNQIEEVGLDGSNPRYVFHNTTTTVEHPSLSSPPAASTATPPGRPRASASPDGPALGSVRAQLLELRLHGVGVALGAHAVVRREVPRRSPAPVPASGRRRDCRRRQGTRN